MVSLNTITTSNATLLNAPKPLTAVFVGATSGIGLATLKAFALSHALPKAYIIGRSASQFQTHLDEIQHSNPKGKFSFIEAEVSLMREVDRVCENIKKKEESFDALWLSCGVLKFGERDETAEGVHMPLALSYFTRLRFIHELLPALNKSSNPRVVSIFGAGMEKEIDINDIEVKRDFTAMKAAQIASTLNTLAFSQLSKTNPKIAFIHKYPGFVNTGSVSRLLSTFTSVIGFIFAAYAKYTIVPLANLFATSTTEAGERGLYLLTSPRYTPVSLRTGNNDEHVEYVESQDGVFRLGATDDNCKDSQVLNTYVTEGADEKIWGATRKVWDQCVGSA